MRPPPDDRIPARFDVVADSGWVAVVRADFRESFNQFDLHRCAGGSLRGTSPVAGGRGGARVLAAHPFGDIVVRPYLRGGWVRHLVTRTYFAGARSFRELWVTEELHTRGAPVPEALAAVKEQARPGPGYHACLVTRRIAGTVPAAELLRKRRAGEIRRWMEEIGRSIRLCHDAGGWHADLNAWNLLVAESRPDLPVIVIDWDRGSLREEGVSLRARLANLARLRRSLKKLELKSALDAWPALERGYESAPGPTPAA